MRKVRNKDTAPEMVVRRLAHQLGFRYRLHRKDLPGTPDLVFVGRRKVIFVHGCFWHRHEGCKRTTMPQTRRQFWTEKFERNAARDLEAVDELLIEGWSVLIIWECETADRKSLGERITAFLS